MSLLRAKLQLDSPGHAKNVWRHMHMLPLAWLHIPRGVRLLIAALSYVPAIVGLLTFFPSAHNGSSMFLTIVSCCWLFRYRGLFVSLLLNGLVFQLAYTLSWREMHLLPESAFVGGALLGFATSLALGLIVCWLRTAVDLVREARQRAFVAEEERLQALQMERQATLAYEYQRKLNAVRDDFLLHVSHEFRTPLTVLGGVLDLLHDYYDRLDAEEREDLLKQAQANHGELANLVEQILGTATMIDALPEAHNEMLSLSQLVREVLEKTDPDDVKAYTLSVQVPEDIIVQADPQFVYQVLQNLLSNVFKYVPAQTEVSIVATRAPSSSLICLYIQDAGPGIPEYEAPQLFEKFVRLKRDLAGTTRGTGLGLYACKLFVEAMGGQIWVESSGKVGEGSRFSFTLPAASPQLS